MVTDKCRRIGFAEFNAKIFKNKNITWFDRKGIIPIGRDKNAEIILNDSQVHGKYGSYLVEIIHKQNGLISLHEFYFTEYLDANDRIDKRPDWTGGFHVWFDSREFDYSIEDRDPPWVVSCPSERRDLIVTKRVRP